MYVHAKEMSIDKLRNYLVYIDEVTDNLAELDERFYDDEITENIDTIDIALNKIHSFLFTVIKEKEQMMIDGKTESNTNKKKKKTA